MIPVTHSGSEYGVIDTVTSIREFAVRAGSPRADGIPKNLILSVIPGISIANQQPLLVAAAVQTSPHASLNSSVRFALNCNAPPRSLSNST